MKKNILIQLGMILLVGTLTFNISAMEEEALTPVSSSPSSSEGSTAKPDVAPIAVPALPQPKSLIEFLAQARNSIGLTRETQSRLVALGVKIADLDHAAIYTFMNIFVPLVAHMKFDLANPTIQPHLMQYLQGESQGSYNMCSDLFFNLHRLLAGDTPMHADYKMRWVEGRGLGIWRSFKTFVDQIGKNVLLATNTTLWVEKNIPGRQHFRAIIQKAFAAWQLERATPIDHPVFRHQDLAKDVKALTEKIGVELALFIDKQEGKETKHLAREGKRQKGRAYLTEKQERLAREEEAREKEETREMEEAAAEVKEPAYHEAGDVEGRKEVEEGVMAAPQRARTPPARFTREQRAREQREGFPPRRAKSP